MLGYLCHLEGNALSLEQPDERKIQLTLGLVQVVGDYGSKVQSVEQRRYMRTHQQRAADASGRWRKPLVGLQSSLVHQIPMPKDTS